MKIHLLIITLFFSVFSFAQQREIDSVAAIINNKSTADSLKVEAYFKLTEYLYLRNFDTIVPLSNKAITIIDRNLKKKLSKSDKNKFLGYKATAINNIGVYFMNTGNSDSALNYYLKTKDIQEKINENEGLSTTYFNIAHIYNKKGDIEKALKYFTDALRIAKRGDFKDQVAMSSMSLGMLFERQNEFEKSLSYYNEAMKYYKETGNKYGISMVNHNLGGYYEKLKEHDKAYKYYEEALKIKEEIGDLIGMGYTLNNMASIHKSKKENTEALRLFNESYNLFVSQNYKEGIANSSGNMSKIYLETGNYTNALRYAEEAYNLAKETGYPDNIKNASLALYNVYDKLKKYDKAIEFYKLYCDMRDSIDNDKNRKAALEANMRHQYDKKQIKDSLARNHEREVNATENAKLDAELKAKSFQQILLFGGLGLVIIFSIFMYNRFRISRNQNRIIEEQKKEVELQKNIVEEKHREITDSINYAERLQRSLMASKNLLDIHLKEYFIYFNPKEKVSGDFYWASELKNGNFLLACADSTGHGVPGAIMSMMNMNSIKESVKEGYIRTDEILNYTRKIIIDTLANDGSAEGGKDGMDCALLSFDFRNNKLQFSLANNPIWLIRNGAIIEYKADKMPVGKHDKHNIPFTFHEVELLKGDLVFLFTDGFADQFGGEKGKKFKYSNLQKLLLENFNEKPIIINEKLNSVFSEWKGDLEQVDDVCIIGIRI